MPGDAFVHLLHRRRCRVRRFQQAADAPRVGFDGSYLQGAVGLQMDVEQGAGLQAQAVADLLGQRDLAFAGQCGEQGSPWGVDLCILDGGKKSSTTRTC